MVVINETISDWETLMQSDTGFIQAENTFDDDCWIFETDYEDENSEDVKDEELPF